MSNESVNGNKIGFYQVSKSYNEFAFKILKALLHDKPKQNILISPFGIAQGLTLLANGAVDETQQAIADLLEINTEDLAGINLVNRSLMQRYNPPMIEDKDSTTSRIKMPDRDDIDYAKKLKSILKNPGKPPEGKTYSELSNTIHYSEKFKINREFQSSCEKNYKAVFNVSNPDCDKEAKRINTMIEKHSHKRIKDMIDRTLIKDTVFALVNIIYFNGFWADPFDEKNTYSGIFNLHDGNTKKVDMMSSFQQTARYYSDNNFQAIELLYDRSSLSMYIFLPSKQSSLDHLIKSMNHNNWYTWIQGLSPISGYLKLPRFNMSFENDLNNIISQSGAGIIFDKYRCNFSKIFDGIEPVWLEEITHKCYMDVNEKGTEAAAITFFGITASLVRNNYDMVVDRPFYISIVDNKTGLILFMGTIYEPVQE